MPLDDALHDREAEARAGVLLAGVQPGEQTEDTLSVLARNSDPVVDDVHHCQTVFPDGCRQMHRWAVAAVELDPVADQVL